MPKPQQQLRYFYAFRDTPSPSPQGPVRYRLRFTGCILRFFRMTIYWTEVHQRWPFCQNSARKLERRSLRGPCGRWGTSEQPTILKNFPVFVPFYLPKRPLVGIALTRYDGTGVANRWFQHRSDSQKIRTHTSNRRTWLFTCGCRSFSMQRLGPYRVPVLTLEGLALVMRAAHRLVSLRCRQPIMIEPIEKNLSDEITWSLLNRQQQAWL